MNKLYTAVGRFERKGSLTGIGCPVVFVSQRECSMDIQEMILWTILNWRIVDARALEELYRIKEYESGFCFQRSMESCLRRLIVRGLVQEGCGETGADALYDLLANLYVIPISESLLLRTLSFIKLTVFQSIPLSVTKKIFARDRRSCDEKRVIHLSKQALLSTAELIKCMEIPLLEICSEQALVEALYADNITTSDNIADLVRSSKSCRPVLESVANLYLRRQIIFERI